MSSPWMAIDEKTVNPVPDWIPTADDWLVWAPLPDAEGTLATARTLAAKSELGFADVARTCFRSWLDLGRWPRTLWRHLSDACTTGATRGSRTRHGDLT